MTQKFIPMANTQGIGASIMFLVLAFAKCCLVQSDIKVKLRYEFAKRPAAIIIDVIM